MSLMPITSSAKKALRASEEKRVYNVRRKNAIDQAVKEVKKLALAGKVKEAKVALSKAQQALDKAAKANYITKNAASRSKSRLSAFVKKTTAKK